MKRPRKKVIVSVVAIMGIVLLVLGAYAFSVRSLQRLG